MNQMLSFVFLVLCAIEATTPPATDGQTPSAPAAVAPVAKSPATRPRHVSQWELDYQVGPLRLFKDGETGEAFWYATYTIVNRTDHDRSIAPQWIMLDEEGRIFNAGDGVSRRVQREVQNLLANPLYEDQTSVLGEIMPGEENAKSGFVIWKAGPEVRRFSILVSGLSNIKKTADHPVTKNAILLKKTRRVDYQMNCDRATLIGEVPLAITADEQNPRWIMR